MDFIILTNPKNISKETSIDKGNYYIVYNFESDDNTKCIYNNQEISIDECKKKIQFFGIECRLYNKNTKLEKKIFNGNNKEMFLGTGAFFAVALSALFLGKE